jgi:hypothetical protein
MKLPLHLIAAVLPEASQSVDNNHLEHDAMPGGVVRRNV